MTRAIVILVLMGGGPLVACVERPLLGDATGDDSSSTSGGGGETSGAPTSSGESGTTGPQPGTTGSSTEPQPGTTTGSTGAESTTCGFVCETSHDVITDTMCDTFKQDCPEGEKCAAYAEGGGGVWNATKCVPVTGDGQPGELCTTMGGGISGFDDCAKGGMCRDVDRANMGVCREFCEAEETDPQCSDDPKFGCDYVVEVFDLCLPRCDPLIQDCSGDDLCIPIGDIFVCVSDDSGDGGAVFDPCEFTNACDKGFMCLNPTAADECDQNAGGCCMPFCDLADPNVVCPGVGTSCVSLYAEGMAPEKHENVGICALP